MIHTKSVRSGDRVKHIDDPGDKTAVVITVQRSCVVVRYDNYIHYITKKYYDKYIVVS